MNENNDKNENKITPDLIKRLRGSSTRKITSRPPKDDTPKEMSEFNGDSVVKHAFQTALDKMKTEPRIEALTSNRRIELLKQLDSFKENGDLEDGLALYKEHTEMINPDHESDDDYTEAWWVKTEYINSLYNQRKASTFWENL